MEATGMLFASVEIIHSYPHHDRCKKPVTWCPFCATAVAEADIAYKDDPCTSVYVKIPMHDDLGKLAGFDLSKTFFVLWTTTIWTLPGNMAICLHPRDSYVLVKAENGETYIMA